MPPRATTCSSRWTSAGSVFASGSNLLNSGSMTYGAAKTPATTQAAAGIQNQNHQRVGDLRMIQNISITTGPPKPHSSPSSLPLSPSQLPQPCTDKPVAQRNPMPIDSQGQIEQGDGQQQATQEDVALHPAASWTDPPRSPASARPRPCPATTTTAAATMRWPRHVKHDARPVECDRLCQFRRRQRVGGRIVGGKLLCRGLGGGCPGEPRGSKYQTGGQREHQEQGAAKAHSLHSGSVHSSVPHRYARAQSRSPAEPGATFRRRRGISVTLLSHLRSQKQVRMAQRISRAGIRRSNRIPTSPLRPLQRCCLQRRSRRIAPHWRRPAPRPQPPPLP